MLIVLGNPKNGPVYHATLSESMMNVHTHKIKFKRIPPSPLFDDAHRTSFPSGGAESYSKYLLADWQLIIHDYCAILCCDLGNLVQSQARGGESPHPLTCGIGEEGLA